MPELPENVFLVVPCYNEAKRLEFSQLGLFDDSCRILFVNDGSTDATPELIAPHLGECVHLLNLDRNTGKGEAVRRGMLHLPSLPGFDETQWVGYWDADLSTGFGELPHFFAYASTCESPVDAIWGTRVRMLGCQIRRRTVRHVAGRAFMSLISVALGVKSYDTQCGAKIFRKGLLEPAFSEPFVSRWIFDVELLLRLHGRTVIECPVREWHDVPGSKIGVFTDAFQVFSDILKIRRRYPGAIASRHE